MVMNIGIDARLYGLEHAGIGRYVKNIIDRVILLDKKNTFTLFLTPQYFNQLNTPNNVIKVVSTLKHYSLAEQLLMPGHYHKANLSLLHVPHFNIPLGYHSPFIVTIHDILWHSHKGLAVTTLNPLTYSLKYYGYKKTIAHVINRSLAIIVPSNFVKKQIAAFYSHSSVENKTKVIYEGVDSNLTTRSKKVSLAPVTQAFINRSDFIVYVGSAYPHKNLETLLSAIILVNVNRTTPIKLVIVSSRSVFLKHIIKLIKTNNLQSLVHLAGFLPDDQLALLLSKSRALIQPSLSEGFGLTGLEAMASQVPVIAASAGALPEVYGSAALYFEPLNKQMLGQHLQQVVDDPNVVKHLIHEGNQQAAKYSWDTAAQKTIELYRQSLKNLAQN